MHTRIPIHLALSSALIALASSATLAFQPLITDDTGTQGDGGNQIELAYNRDRLKMDGSLTRTSTVPLVFTRGVSETLDFFVGASHVRMRSSDPDTSASGMGNPVFGLKWRFYENEASGTSLGLKPEIALPVSAKREVDGLGTGKLSSTLTLIATQTVPFGAIHANAVLGATVIARAAVIRRRQSSASRLRRSGMSPSIGKSPSIPVRSANAPLARVHAAILSNSAPSIHQTVTWISRWATSANRQTPIRRRSPAACRLA